MSNTVAHESSTFSLVSVCLCRDPSEGLIKTERNLGAAERNRKTRSRQLGSLSRLSSKEGTLSITHAATGCLEIAPLRACRKSRPLLMLAKRTCCVCAAIFAARGCICNWRGSKECVLGADSAVRAFRRLRSARGDFPRSLECYLMPARRSGRF